MKKFLSFMAVSSALVLSAFAEEGDGYRRTWDFTKGWSVQTVDNLNADEENWQVQSTGFQNKVNQATNAEVTVKVNGELVAIPELAGITISGNLYKAKHLQIVTTASGVPDTPCFWLNGKGDAVSVIVPAGENVKFGYTSHKGGEIRGFKVSGGFADADGKTEFTTSENKEIQEVELINKNTEEAKLTLTTTNGSHLYYIIIGDGDANQEIEEDPNVAYIYSGDVDEDAFRQYAGLDDYATVTNIAAGELLDGTVSVDSLMTYDVAVLAQSAFAVDGAADFFAANLNYLPILNLYPAAGLGYEVVDAATPAITVGEDFLDADIFADLEFSGDNDDELLLFNGETGVLGYTLVEGSDFADDEVYAKAGEANAIHLHSKKNSYILLPIDATQVIADDDLNLSEAGLGLISNTVKYLASTKTNVLKAAKPGVTYKYEDGKTTVSLSSSLAGKKIFYTLDGTEPTKQSTLYSEPLVFTQPATLKAKVYAPAYYESDVVEEQVIIKTQLAAPQISVADGTVTITAAEGATIYFNYIGSAKVDESVAYTEPFTVAEPVQITAFATSDVALQSETVSENVAISGYVYRFDILAHFDAKRAIYGTAENFAVNSNGSPYLFSWGKTAVSPFDSTQIVSQTTVPDVNGNDSTVIEYAIKAPETVESDTWVIASSGQIVTNETNTPILSVGDGVAAGYYAETVDDTRLANDSIGITSEMVNFKGKASGTPYTATISTKTKYAGPFDVIVYTANGGTGNPQVELQLSADGQTWETFAPVKFAQTRRYRSRTKVAYNETNEVYVRVAHVGGGSDAIIYDIYLLNEGEHTQDYLGIPAIEENAAAAVRDNVIYNILGQKVDAAYKGIVIRGGRKVIVR